MTNELHHQFEEIAALIKAARSKAFYEVNRRVIELYWEVGKYIFERTKNGSWGKSIVKNLADFLYLNIPNPLGFSAQNLWRMKQFFETYQEDVKLSPLVREISWTNNLLILSGTKSSEEKEFYLRLCKREHYSKRELERQLSSGLFERVALSQKGNYPEILPGKDLKAFGFRDAYLLDFLKLPDGHSEKDLRKSILRDLKNFILEFGKDFILIGEEFPVQVGKDDFFIDLLFFHRELCCLVPFDLKIDRFKPEYVGKMDFYLEALDRDYKKPHENPSVGVLLCKEKDDEIVEIALSRSLSPTMIATYETHLIGKELLRNKLHEFYEVSLLGEDEA
jgi:predicted nuclease of restriction endonuclease-like (RecB) superfamily